MGLKDLILFITLLAMRCIRLNESSVYGGKTLTNGLPTMLMIGKSNIDDRCLPTGLTINTINISPAISAINIIDSLSIDTDIKNYQ